VLDVKARSSNYKMKESIGFNFREKQSVLRLGERIGLFLK
jgi:hypothetical protein